MPSLGCESRAAVQSAVRNGSLRPRLVCVAPVPAYSILPARSGVVAAGASDDGISIVKVSVTWLLRGCHVAVTWLLRGCHVAVTWLLRGCYEISLVKASVT